MNREEQLPIRVTLSVILRRLGVAATERTAIVSVQSSNPPGSREFAPVPYGKRCAQIAAEVVMKTGQTVDDLGLYSSECCSVELTFDVGDVFSRCPQCQHRCVWELESELVPADELEREAEIAA